MKALIHAAICVIALHGAPVLAKNHICWIDHVASDPKGVRVFFSRSAEGHWGAVSIEGKADQRQYKIEDGRVKEGNTTESSLLLVPGESATLVGSPEDSCQFMYAEAGGRRGISAHANFAPPGLTRESVDDFIPENEHSQ